MPTSFVLGAGFPIVQRVGCVLTAVKATLPSQESSGTFLFNELRSINAPVVFGRTGRSRPWHCRGADSGRTSRSWDGFLSRFIRVLLAVLAEPFRDMLTEPVRDPDRFLSSLGPGQLS